MYAVGEQPSSAAAMIIVPFASDCLRLETSLWAMYAGATLAELGDDVYAYGRLLDEFWTGTDDLVVVEQDIQPGIGVIDSFGECPEPWCTSPYWVGRHTPYQDPPPNGPRRLSDSGYLVHGLGCVRFSQSLQQMLPRLAERAKGEWRGLDARVNDLLRTEGFVPHTHAPSRHLNGEEPEEHDCCPACGCPGFMAVGSGAGTLKRCHACGTDYDHVKF